MRRLSQQSQPSRTQHWVILTIIIGVGFLSACTTPRSYMPPVIDPDHRMSPPSNLTDPVLLEGKQHYDLLCAHCHGYTLGGQLPQTIQQTLDLGMITVPPHDSTGHTWQHPDQLLIRTIREGIQNPLAQYPMPAFGSALTDAQLNAILAYIKTYWTEEQRQYQQRLTDNWAQLDARFGMNDNEIATAEAAL